MAVNTDILIVDDDLDFATGLAKALEAKGSSVTIAATAAETTEKLRERPLTDVVLLDINLPDRSGLELIGEIKGFETSISVIVITVEETLETAVTAMREGACDYVVKPVDLEALWVRIEHAVESHRAIRSVRNFEREMSELYGFEQFVYTSEAMQAAVDQMKQLTDSDATVLITGESGVGKELAAKALHFNSPRRLGPFIAASCAAVPETLIENELFGHEKGAFTGAYERQLGKFELANGGTIFLDEIGDLSPVIQTKLLRVLQEKSFHRIGGVNEINVDVRIICATNRDLIAAVADEEFRSDLFYRISVLPVMLPPLRERQEDIELLAEHFLNAFSRKLGKPFEGFSDDALKLMLSYPWPGNVRELQNAVERAVVLGKPPHLQAKDITLGPLSKSIRRNRGLEEGIMSLREMEAAHIASALSHFEWNISKAAHHLGIGRDTLYRKIKQYGIKHK